MPPHLAATQERKAVGLQLVKCQARALSKQGIADGMSPSFEIWLVVQLAVVQERVRI